jgi:hypothetical protein
MFLTKVVQKSKQTFFVQKRFDENRAVYEMMWNNMVQSGRLQTTIWLMLFACWITEARDTHSECVLFIAVPRQE